MSAILDRFYERSSHLITLLDSDPIEAVKQAREIDLDTPDRFNLMSLRAAILVNGGALIQQQDAIEEGLVLFRELHSLFPTADITYNLANGLVATAGSPLHDPSWIDFAVLDYVNRDSVVFFCKAGQKVELEGNIVFAPSWTATTDNLLHRYAGRVS